MNRASQSRPRAIASSKKKAGTHPEPSLARRAVACLTMPPILLRAVVAVGIRHGGVLRRRGGAGGGHVWGSGVGDGPGRFAGADFDKVVLA